MTNITISDECFSPDKYLYFNYSGPDPWAVVNHINDTARDFFHLGASDWCFERLNWDISGDPIDFWALFSARVEVSGHTKIMIYIRVQGKTSKTTNKGNFTMRLHALVNSEFEGYRVVLKPLWYIYSYLFFNNVRRSYLRRCQTLVMAFRDEIKRYYNMNVYERS